MARHAATGEPHQDDPGPPEGPERREGYERRAPTAKSRLDGILATVLILMAVASVVISTVSVTKREADAEAREREVACQTAFNIAFADALAERTRAASQDRQAITTLVKATIALSPDPELRAQQYADATRAFLLATAAADAKREDNPFPTPRSCLESGNIGPSPAPSTKGT